MCTHRPQAWLLGLCLQSVNLLKSWTTIPHHPTSHCQKKNILHPPETMKKPSNAVECGPGYLSISTQIRRSLGSLDITTELLELLMKCSLKLLEHRVKSLPQPALRPDIGSCTASSSAHSCTPLAHTSRALVNIHRVDGQEPYPTVDGTLQEENQGTCNWNILEYGMSMLPKCIVDCCIFCLVSLL